MRVSAKLQEKPKVESLSYFHIADRAMKKAQQKAIKEDILYGLKPVLVKTRTKTKRAN